MGTSLASRLIDALGEDRIHTALVVSATYQPVGGTGMTVMPPSFPIGSSETDLRKKYAVAPRLVDGERVEVVAIDQEQSQANRVEEALLQARDGGRLAYPLFELRAKSSGGEIRLTSLDFPHRYADAYLRDSMVDGVRFDQSATGQRLRAVSAEDVRPLFEREPASLVYGAWDSHRKGRWPKFARLYTATMYGLSPEFGDRRGGRMDPVNLTGLVDDTAKAENSWAFVAEGTKAKGTKLSEIGHGNIAPNRVPGGVTVKEIRRIASVSFAGLERLRFGGVPPEASIAARATLAALALAGDRLAFGKPSVWLRSGCDLNKSNEVIGLEKAGGELDEIVVTVKDVLDAFHELQAETARLGLVMATDLIEVVPIPALAQAIEFAVSQSVSDGE
jgi:CRISPR-associated protein Csb1